MGLLEDTLNRIVPLSSETEEEIRTRWNRLYLGLTYMGNAVDMMVHYALSGNHAGGSGKGPYCAAI